MQLRRFANKAALDDELVRILQALFQAPGPANTPAAILLAGGETPRAAYERLAKETGEAGHALWLMLTDERMVPPDSADSNFARVGPLAGALAVPPNRILLVDTEKAPAEAATLYDQDIRDFLASGGIFPLCLLGLGGDGHTAALFSPDDLARGKDRFATAVDRPDGRAGVSITPLLLQRVERLIFVVSGANKRQVVQTLLDTPHALTAGLAVAGHAHVEIWVDDEAAPGDA